MGVGGESGVVHRAFPGPSQMESLRLGAYEWI